MPKLLDPERGSLYIIEVTTSGEIVVYSSKVNGAPLIVAHDRNPIPIRYVAFGSHVEYFYDCVKDTEYNTMRRHPLLEQANMYPRDCKRFFLVFLHQYV